MSLLLKSSFHYHLSSRRFVRSLLLKWSFKNLFNLKQLFLHKLLVSNILFIILKSPVRLYYHGPRQKCNVYKIRKGGCTREVRSHCWLGGWTAIRSCQTIHTENLPPRVGGGARYTFPKTFPPPTPGGILKSRPPFCPKCLPKSRQSRLVPDDKHHSKPWFSRG